TATSVKVGFRRSCLIPKRRSPHLNGMSLIRRGGLKVTWRISIRSIYLSPTHRRPLPRLAVPHVGRGTALPNSDILGWIRGQMPRHLLSALVFVTRGIVMKTISLLLACLGLSQITPAAKAGAITVTELGGFGGISGIGWNGSNWEYIGSLQIG